MIHDLSLFPGLNAKQLDQGCQSGNAMYINRISDRKGLQLEVLVDRSIHALRGRKKSVTIPEMFGFLMILIKQDTKVNPTTLYYVQRD